MTIETSHGKARPTLPRSSDLQAVPAPVGEPSASRDAAGRFAPGNVVGRGKGWKRAIARLLGRDVSDPVAVAVAHDAWTIFAACIRELPHDGPIVRGLVAQKARHDALAGFWAARAVEVGLTTDEGITAQTQATLHGQRAERLTVTALDVATKLAATRPRAPTAADTPWFVPTPPKESP